VHCIVCYLHCIVFGWWSLCSEQVVHVCNATVCRPRLVVAGYWTAALLSGARSYGADSCCCSSQVLLPRGMAAACIMKGGLQPAAA
jgi:hypothetical protein